MTDQPKQGKDETPEGYQPTLRLPEHQQDVPQQQAPAAGQDEAQPAAQQPGFPQQPSAGQQAGQQSGPERHGWEQHGRPAADQDQFSSPYPPIYGGSGHSASAPGSAAYGQQAQPYGQQSQYAQPGSYNAYGQPAYYGVPAAPKTLSIASMCCGIAALVGFGFFLLPQLAAVILGHLALRREPAGRGMAIAGLVMGYVGIAVTILVLVIFGLVIGSAARNSGYGV